MRTFSIFLTFLLSALTMGACAIQPVDAGSGGAGGSVSTTEITAETLEAITCSLPAHAAFACQENWGNCDGDMGNGCETSLGTMSNCGGCGIKCGVGQHCGPGCNNKISCYPSPTNCPVNPCEGKAVGDPCSIVACSNGTCASSFGSSLECACPSCPIPGGGAGIKPRNQG